MDKIQRLPDSVRATRPVDRGHEPTTGRDGEAFKEILERRQRHRERDEAERDEMRPDGEKEQKEEQAEGSSDPQRGRLLDERA